MTSILQYVSKTLLMSEHELLAFALSAPHRYKKYYIKKRTGGGFRLIAQPSKETKFIQKVVVEKLRQLLPIHRCAMAYEKGTGIRLNALHHKDNRYLLKMDFSDFFPSVTPSLFFLASADCGIEFCDSDKKFLSSILFFKLNRESRLRLSIGAPSSPFVSNFVMYRFDEITSTYCFENKINYTRYADDITFSSNVKNLLFNLPTIVKRNLRQTTLNLVKINRAKTIFSSKAFNRHVTGVVLANDATLSLGHDKKRLYSSMIHKFSLGQLQEEKRLHLKGLLSHSLYIEPEFLNRMKEKYSSEVIDNIFR